MNAEYFRIDLLRWTTPGQSLPERCAPGPRFPDCIGGFVDLTPCGVMAWMRIRWHLQP